MENYINTNKLTIDVGNSFSKIAVFSDGKIVEFERTNNLKVGDLETWCEEFEIRAIAYSASGSDAEDVISFIQAFPNHVFLAHDVNMPILLKYTTPETLGRDRIAAVLGAHHLFPNENAIVIDLGTCTTFEFKDKNGNYWGGNIAPGIQMRFQAMYDYTARLPLVEMEGKVSIIGDSTENAIRNGAVIGALWEIESFISNIEKTYGESQVIFTGGDAIFMSEMIKQDVLVEPYLIHVGLYELLTYQEFNR